MDILKAETDTRAFRFLALENGLKAILIDNGVSRNGGMGEPPQEERPRPSSSAAICVGVGSLKDPPYLQGLAHLTQHLIYPTSTEEGTFGSFVFQNGGTLHADTTSDSMLFFFEIEKGFPKALKTFHNLFTQYVITEDNIDDEIRVIEQEFRRETSNLDSFRKLILADFLSTTQHPLGRFTKGNEITLKIIPRSQGINIKEHIMEFIERNFSYCNMHLVVESPQSLDVLENLVSSIFNSIQSNLFPHLPTFSRSLSLVDFHQIIKVSTPVESNHLVLTWALPQVRQFFKTKPLHILAWLISNEGKDGLVDFLRQNAWISNFDAGNRSSNFESNPMNTSFSILIELSKKGASHIFDIVTAILEYLEMIKLKFSAIQQFFSDLRAIRSNEFQYQNLPKVDCIARNTLYYGLRYCLIGDKCLVDFDQTCLELCLNHLSHNSFNLMLMSNHIDASKCDKKDPWLNIPYFIQEIPTQWKTAWNQLVIRNNFKLPEPNQYIPTEVTLKPSNEEPMMCPICLVDRNWCRIWYKKCIGYKNTLINLNLISTVPNISILFSVIGDMVTQFLSDTIRREISNAWIAGYRFSLTSNSNGILIHVSGNPQKMSMVLNNIVDIVSALNVNELQIKILQSNLKEYYQNIFEDPKAFAEDIRLSILDEFHWLAIDKMQRISDATDEMVDYYWTMFKTNLFVQGFIQGNLTKEEIIEIYENIIRKLERPDMIPVLLEGRTLKLSRGLHACSVLSMNTHNYNSVLSYYFQCPAIDDAHMFELIMVPLMQMLYERMQEYQNAIAIHSEINSLFGILGFTISAIVPSDRISCSKVSKTISRIIRKYKDMLWCTDENQFARLKDLILAIKEAKDGQFEDNFERNWKEISSFKYNFERYSSYKNNLREFSYEDFIHWVRTYRPFNNYPRLSVQVVGHKDPSVTDQMTELMSDDAPKMIPIIKDEEGNRQIICDIRKFRSSMPLFPNYFEVGN